MRLLYATLLANSLRLQARFALETLSFAARVCCCHSNSQARFRLSQPLFITCKFSYRGIFFIVCRVRIVRMYACCKPHSVMPCGNISCKKARRQIIADAHGTFYPVVKKRADDFVFSFFKQFIVEMAVGVDKHNFAFCQQSRPKRRLVVVI